MRALIVVESVFGNTRRIADEIAAGLTARDDVTAVDLVTPDVAATTVPEDVDLLVVGAPTHAMTLSRPNTRQQGAMKIPDSKFAVDTGVRDWLAALAKARPGVTTAVFDTRLAKPSWLVGSAARGIKQRLAKLGYPVAATEHFSVESTEGPLTTGEPERAREWAEHLAVPAGV